MWTIKLVQRKEVRILKQKSGLGTDLKKRKAK